MLFLLERQFHEFPRFFLEIFYYFKTKLNNVSTDEAALDEKIERKKREYEQMQKRYAKLQVGR